MKILYITGDDDYGANDFEEVYGGTSVDSLIARVEKGEPLTTPTQMLTAKVIEAGDPSHEFIDLIRERLLDYDHSKHHNFYCAGDNV